jgi:hypothetical protein
MNFKWNDHAGFITGILITILIGSILTTFKESDFEFSKIPDVFLFIILAIFIFPILGLVTTAVSWIFTRNFTLKKWIKHVAVISLIWTFLAIISFVENKL